MRGRWVARAAITDSLKLIAMVCGRARLATDGMDGPVELEPGDVAVLNGRSWLEVEGDWRLDELARAAAMSRTSFAERFRMVAGVPPLTYLNRWRMLLAQRALRHGEVRVGSLASDLGYASESAFSTAFKREVGESPLRYRYRVRDGAASRADPLTT